MRYEGKSVKDVKLAYIGGGSQGWAWTFMNDLKQSHNMSGTVYLYDIDFQAAKEFAFDVIKANSLPGKVAPQTAGEIIGRSILPIIQKGLVL